MLYKRELYTKGNIFVDFIDEINKNGDRSIIFMSNGDLFTIFASQRIEIINDKFLKIFDDNNVVVKIYSIDDIVGVERV